MTVKHSMCVRSDYKWLAATANVLSNECGAVDRVNNLKSKQVVSKYVNV